MEEKLISEETGKLAKEKGFNIPCWKYIDIYGEEDDLMGFIGDTFEEKFDLGKASVDFYLPTQTFLQKWLREEHNINVYCTPCEHDESLWYNNIASQTPVFTGTYEESLEVGLLEVLKLIKI